MGLNGGPQALYPLVNIYIHRNRILKPRSSNAANSETIPHYSEANRPTLESRTAEF
jgi:hypothetical protein